MHILKLIKDHGKEFYPHNGEKTFLTDFIHRQGYSVNNASHFIVFYSAALTYIT